MEPLVYKNINIKPNKTYFLTGLTNRFDHTNDSFRSVLDEYYSSDTEPIYIFQNMPSEQYQKKNFIIVNRSLIGKDFRTVVNGMENEDLSIDLSNSEEFKNIITKILENQDRVFFMSFTSSFLEINEKGFIYIGPKPDIATYYDNKLNQFKLFDSLGLRHTNFRYYKNQKEIKSSEKLPFYISSAYSSGGLESKAVFSFEEMREFIDSWRDFSKKQIIITDYIDNVDYFPNTTALVYGPNKVKFLTTTDQILRGSCYIGNLYPCEASKAIQERIKKMTIEVGKAVSQKGYRGLFGCDFMVKGSNVFIHDLNPRRQGGYGMLQLMCGDDRLSQSELLATLGIEKCLVKQADFDKDFCWGHSKIKPYDNEPHQLLGKAENGTVSAPLKDIGSNYVTSFYSAGSVVDNTYPAYCFATSYAKQTVIDAIKKNNDFFLNKLYFANCSDKTKSHQKKSERYAYKVCS
jgi:hypothetical protein